MQLRCGVRAASRSRRATIGRVPARRRQGTRAGQALGDLQAQRRGDLKERGSEGALGSDGQAAGLARNPSGPGPQATTGAGQQWPGGLQEGAGAARPRRQTGHRLQSRRQPDGSVGRGQVVVSLVARRVGHSAARLDVGARVCLALMTCEGGNNSGIDCELGSMPKQEPLRDNLNAPFIGDGHIGVHLGEADVASDPRPRLLGTHSRRCAQGAPVDRPPRQDGRCGGVAVRGSCIFAARATMACASAAAVAHSSRWNWALQIC